MAITKYTPDPEWDDDPDFMTGTWDHDDGTSLYGQMPRSEGEQYLASASDADKQYADELGMPEIAGQQALAANSPVPDVTPQVQTTAGQAPVEKPAPDPYDAWEQKRVEQEQAGGASGVNIPKSSRIAYVHNNPGNLKYAGQDGAQEGEPAQDGGHWAAFETPEAGYAALHGQVDKDAARGMTVGQFIGKYAPPESNDTAQYTKQASEALGVSPDAPLSSVNRERVARFMAQKESGTQIGGAIPANPPSPGQATGQSALGLPLAAVEMQGRQLSPEEIALRQQGVMGRTMQQVGGVQQMAAAKQQGRNEAMGMVEANYRDQQTNQQRQLAEAVQIKQQAQKNVADAMSTQIDPGKVLKGMSAGDAILGMLSFALSGVGVGIGRFLGHETQNEALAAFDKAIQTSIDSQKEDKQSRLAHWTRIFGDAQQGEKAARAEMYDSSAKFLATKAATTVENADIQASAMQQAQALQAAGQKEAADLTTMNEEKLKLKYQAPEPVKANPDNLVKAIQSAKQARQELEVAGVPPEQIAGILAQHGLADIGGATVEQDAERQKTEKKDDAATATDLADIKAARETWSTALANLDKVENHALVSKDYHPMRSATDVVSTNWPGTPNVREVDAFRQSLSAGANAQIRAEKGPQTEGDVERQMQEITGAGRISDIRAGIQAKLKALEEKERALDARSPGSLDRVKPRYDATEMPVVTGRVKR